MAHPLIGRERDALSVIDNSHERAMMTPTISLKAGSRQCSIKALCKFHSTRVASARLSPRPTASDFIGSRYERLGNDLIALGTLEGPRLDIPGRTNPRQHHTRLAARTPRALDNARRNDRGVSLLHGTPLLLGESTPELTVTVRCPDGPAITECTKLPSICPLPDSTQKLRSAWNDRGSAPIYIFDRIAL